MPFATELIISKLLIFLVVQACFGIAKTLLNTSFWICRPRISTDSHQLMPATYYLEMLHQNILDSLSTKVWITASYRSLHTPTTLADGARNRLPGGLIGALHTTYSAPLMLQNEILLR